MYILELVVVIVCVAALMYLCFLFTELVKETIVVRELEERINSRYVRKSKPKPLQKEICQPTNSITYEMSLTLKELYEAQIKLLTHIRNGKRVPYWSAIYAMLRVKKLPRRKKKIVKAYVLSKMKEYAKMQNS